MTSFDLKYLFKDPTSKYSHILRYGELGLRHMNLEGVGDTIQAINTYLVVELLSSLLSLPRP